MSEKAAGIVGCGLIADTHVEAIRAASPETAIVACDSLPGKAELLRRKFGLKKAYRSMDEMLERERPFSVHVLTPPALHLEQAKKAMDAGAHVLVEKPVAFTSAEVDELYRFAGERSKVLCADHSLLRQPSILKMLEVMKGEPAERVLHVNCFYGMDLELMTHSQLPRNHWKRSLPGGPLVDTAIHPISLAVELTGRPGETRTRYFGLRERGEELHFCWTGEEGIASVTVSMNAQPFRRVTEVVTNRHTFTIDHSTETLVVLDSGTGPKSLRKVLRNVSYGYQLSRGTAGTVAAVLRGKLKENPGTRGVVERYYRHIDGEGDLPVTEANVRHSIRVLESVAEALRPATAASPPAPAAGTGESVPADRKAETILVTGASGFLGREICDALAGKGYRVKAQVRRGANADRISSESVEKIYEDFDHEDADYDGLAAGADVVIHSAHAAGAKTWEGFERVNVNATMRLYEAAARAGCGRFIFLSSVAVYGMKDRFHRKVDEDAPTTEGRSRFDFYVRSKTIAERKLLERAGSGGPRLLIIRPGVLYGADGMRLARRSIPLRSGRLVIQFGNGGNTIPFTRSDVLAESIGGIVDKERFKEGVYNFTGSSGMGSREFIAERMKWHGVECRFLPVPAFPFRMLAAGLEWLYSVTLREKPPFLTRYLIDSATRDIEYDNARARRDFGWDPEKAAEP